MNRILLVEDDPSIVRSLSELLRENAFCVDAASTQREALSLLANAEYDLALLDLTLPDGSGYSVCAAIRQAHPETAAIFLTAAGDEPSVVAGLEMGADDYVAKPFRPMELISRIRAALRKRGKTQSVFMLGDVSVDSVRGRATQNGREVPLSALEYRLLLMFASHKGQVLTREQLLSALWDADADFVTDNTLTVYIKRLREKIEPDPQNPVVIKTVRGLGYKAGD